MRSPSRRDVLAAGGGGLLAGLAGGYVARPRLSSDSDPEPAPFAWADTEWPYPDYDPGRTRNPPPESAPDGDLTEQWRQAVHSGKRPAVVASNGRVFAGTPYADHGRVACLDAESGDEQWAVHAGDSRGAMVAAPGDRVFTRGDGQDVLASRAAATGETLWTTSTTGVGEPFLGGGRQYVLGTGVEADRLRALNARTGSGLWTTALPGGYFPAVAYDDAGDRVIVGSDSTVACLDAGDGSTLWEEKEFDGNGFVTGPVVADGRVYHAAFQVGVAAFDANTGERLWQEPFDPALRDANDPEIARYFHVSAATADVLLAVEGHGDDRAEQLVALDAATGDRLWRTDYGGEAAVSRPTIVDGTAYASVGTDAGQELVAVDLADGEETGSWALPTYGGAPVVADGRVVVPTSDAVVAFR